MIILNKDSLELDLFEYVEEAFASLPVQVFKYKRWDWAYENIPTSVKPLLQKMLDLMATHDDKNLRWLVDYKVKELKVGECGCMLDGWHLDVVENPHHESKPDIHIIYSTEFGTEFLTRKIPVFPDEDHFEKTLSIYNQDALEKDVVSSKPNHVSMYNRFQLHRGPKVTRDCKRMLLRLTATEVIK